MTWLFPAFTEVESQIRSTACLLLNFIVVKSMLGSWLWISRSERQKVQEVQKSKLMITSLLTNLFYNTLNEEKFWTMHQAIIECNTLASDIKMAHLKLLAFQWLSYYYMFYFPFFTPIVTHYTVKLH